MKGLVSAIIPVRDGADYLEEAVLSARRQPEIREVLVVDDGSVDATPEIARRLGVGYVRQQARGPSAARNRGLSHSRCDFVALLDADDLWPDGSLGRLLACFTADPALEVVWGESQLFRDVAGERRPGRRGFVFQIGSALFRRSAFGRVGRFDESMRSSEDVDWFLRSREAGLPMRMLEATTVLYRQHERNMTRGKSAQELQFLHAFKKSFERRRGAPGTRPLPLPPLLGGPST